MTIKKKYLWHNPTFDDIEWVMHNFQRRCDVQSVPRYAGLMMEDINQTYITIQNEKDDIFFLLKYPDAVLISSEIYSE